VGAHPDSAHRLHAGGHRDVVGARDDALRGEVDRLLAGPALAVDGHRGHVLRESGGQPAVAAHRRLLTDLAHATDDHVVDLAGSTSTRANSPDSVWPSSSTACR